MTIEGWPWREALYMTVITVTAVGFQEVRQLSEPGRDFTMILLAGGLTGIGVWFALITSFIVEFDLTDHRKKRWRSRMLESLNGHISSVWRWANGSAGDGGADRPGAVVRGDRKGFPAARVDP